VSSCVRPERCCTAHLFRLHALHIGAGVTGASTTGTRSRSPRLDCSASLQGERPRTLQGPCHRSHRSHHRPSSRWEKRSRWCRQSVPTMMRSPQWQLVNNVDSGRPQGPRRPLPSTTAPGHRLAVDHSPSAQSIRGGSWRPCVSSTARTRRSHVRETLYAFAIPRGAAAVHRRLATLGRASETARSTIGAEYVRVWRPASDPHRC